MTETVSRKRARTTLLVSQRESNDRVKQAAASRQKRTMIRKQQRLSASNKASRFSISRASKKAIPNSPIASLKKGRDILSELLAPLSPVSPLALQVQSPESCISRTEEEGRHVDSPQHETNDMDYPQCQQDSGVDMLEAILGDVNCCQVGGDEDKVNETLEEARAFWNFGDVSDDALESPCVICANLNPLDSEEDSTCISLVFQGVLNEDTSVECSNTLLNS